MFFVMTSFDSELVAKEGHKALHKEQTIPTMSTYGIWQLEIPTMSTYGIRRLGMVLKRAFHILTLLFTGSTIHLTLMTIQTISCFR